jgi:glycosyltransferase involved in cell wall biosynthesis
MTIKKKIRVGLVVPHIFIHRDILPGVIFSPGTLAVDLAEELEQQGADVVFFAPGPVRTAVPVITADLSHFDAELAGRNDTYLELLKKHPFTFISLARQVQAEIIAKAYEMANAGLLDIVHIYTNEEDIALPFAKFCKKPVVFTHHDPFNFLVKYKSVFPKYKHLNWISISNAQRSTMPSDTNWVETIYHGLPENELTPLMQPTRDYVAYLGRIIEPKGVHLAIQAVKKYNETAKRPLKLKIAGKHYADHVKDTYWQTQIKPQLSNTVEYIGHIKGPEEKRLFLGNAAGLIMPSVFDEPFGMVAIEALACDTPVIGLASGAIPEVIKNNSSGFVIKKYPEETVIDRMAAAIENLQTIKPGACRDEFETRFTSKQMTKNHLKVYEKLLATK